MFILAGCGAPPECKSNSFTIFDSTMGKKYDWSFLRGLTVSHRGAVVERVGLYTCGEAAAHACDSVERDHGESVPGCWPY